MSVTAITLDQLQQRIDNVGKKTPQVVKKAAAKGVNVLSKEMRRRYKMSGLKKRSGMLYDSIGPIMNKRNGFRVTFAAGVGMSGGHSQVYKGATHEKGGVISNAGWHKNTTITIPARPFVEPTRKAKLGEVRDLIGSMLEEAIARGIS